MQQMIEARLAPAHAHPLEALLDEPLACTLHTAATDRQSLLPIARVVEVLVVRLQIRAEILQRLAHGWAQVARGARDIELGQDLIDRA